MPCGNVARHQRFRGTCSLHIRSWSSLHTLRYTSEDQHRRRHPHEDLRSHPVSLLLPVVSQSYEVQVYRAHVLLGNTAVLHCVIPAFVKDYVTVTSWFRDDTIILPARDDAGKKTSVNIDAFVRTKMAVFWVVAPRRLVWLYQWVIVLVMQAVQTSETSVNSYQSTRRYNTEDSQFHTHRRENLKSYLYLKFDSSHTARKVSKTSRYENREKIKVEEEPWETSHLTVKKSFFGHEVSQADCARPSGKGTIANDI
jgi:hypothetical protein